MGIRIERIEDGAGGSRMPKYKGICIGGVSQGFFLSSDSSYFEERERLGTGGPEYIINRYYFHSEIVPDGGGFTGVWLYEGKTPMDAERYLNRASISYRVIDR